MAQLTDDCFAFSGPLLPVDELEKIIAERITESTLRQMSSASCSTQPDEG